MEDFMMRKSLFSFLSVSVSVIGCGLLFTLPGCGDSGSSKGNYDVDMKDHESEYEQQYRDMVYNSYPSDISDENATRCSEGKPFAFGKCWDSLFISDEGEVSLTKDGQKEVLFLAKTKYISPLISRYYSYSRSVPWSGDQTIKNHFMTNRYQLTSNWFLSPEYDLSDSNNDHSIENQTLKEGSFSLIETDYLYGAPTIKDAVIFNQLNGVIQLKGKNYKLPLTQKNIEEACANGKPLGDAFELDCKLDSVNFEFYMKRSPKDQNNDAQWTQRRVASDVNIKMQ